MIHVYPPMACVLTVSPLGVKFVASLFESSPGYGEGMTSKSANDENEREQQDDVERDGSLPTGAHKKPGKGAAGDRSKPFEEAPAGAGRHGDVEAGDSAEPRDTSGRPNPQ